MAFVDQRLGDFLALVEDRTRTPGGGAVAAHTASLAAGLVAQAGTESAGAAADLGRRAAALADEGGAAQPAVMLAIAETAASIAKCAADVFVHGGRESRGDAATALLLAEGATRAAAYLVEGPVDAVNADREMVHRARACIAAAQAAHDLAGRRVPVTAEH